MIEAATRISAALKNIHELMQARCEPPQAVAKDPLKDADIADLLHPDIWVDGFTVAQIAAMTGRKPESYDSEVRALVNRGIIRVELPGGTLVRNPALPRPDMFNVPTRAGGFKGLV